jgi:lipopolysaccharide/colanic/teichoic acid biosynthesis glycosyltransferase
MCRVGRGTSILCNLSFAGMRNLSGPRREGAVTPTKTADKNSSSLVCKRCLDILISALILLLTSPILALAALAVWIESGSPVFFRQERVGRGFSRFQILKLRSMQVDNRGPVLTVAGDRRITRVGRVIRATKIDELPQLWNVFRGEMSVVGPRPTVPELVESCSERYRKILTMRPGITDLASIYYRNEEQILARARDPVIQYRERILPVKLKLAERYLRQRSGMVDFVIMLRTAAVTLLPELYRELE